MTNLTVDLDAEAHRKLLAFGQIGWGIRDTASRMIYWIWERAVQHDVESLKQQLRSVMLARTQVRGINIELKPEVHEQLTELRLQLRFRNLHEAMDAVVTVFYERKYRLISDLKSKIEQEMMMG